MTSISKLMSEFLGICSFPIGDVVSKLPQTWLAGHFTVALVPSCSYGIALSQHLKTSEPPTVNVFGFPSPSSAEEVTIFPLVKAPVHVIVAQSPVLHLSPVPAVLTSI